MVAVRMRDLGRALGKLDDQSRALLELSLRRAMADDEIAAVLLQTTDEVEERRAELLERLAEELHVDTHEGRDELFATIQDLPAGHWRSES
ncbi:MAG TPA: hypothetical protein VGF21_09010 [Thermoleophilaceae bacterium]